MNSKLTSGWLPIEIGVDLQPALVDEALVRWMEFGSTVLAEPFIGNTVERLRKEIPVAREIDTDIETLVRMGARLPTVRPAGFVFHISHCGSTLIANALKTSTRGVVASESRVVSYLLRTILRPAAGPFLKDRWERKRRILLDSLFSLFAHYRTGEEEPLVLKFVSLDTLSIRLVREYWPDVPCVIVIRDPVEVMVTTVKGGGWATLKDQPLTAAAMFDWAGRARSTVDMTNEEFCARVLGSYCAAAVEGIGQEKSMIVDYVDLNPAKMLEIGDFFGIDLRDGKGVDQVFNSYAKDPKKGAKFSDDRERKQREASVMVRSAANEWAMPAYAELRNRRRRSGR